jgi:TrmH family RNA methyltransferase
MLSKTIASLQHPQVIYWMQLRKERSQRIENTSLLISGEKLVRELSLQAPLRCLMTLSDMPEIPAKERYLVNRAILKKITGVENPDGYAAEIPLPPPSDLSNAKFLLILDQIADPGNLGTLLRTAHALRWEGVVATPGTVDLFNDKALRSAKGATFRLPYAIVPAEELISWKTSLYVADIKGQPISSTLFHSPRALVLSNEARGPSSWNQSVGQKIHIPMRKSAESLNVASAGAILLYTMGPS